MENIQDRSGWMKVLSWGIYGLAATTLGISLLVGLSVGSASAVVPAATIGFQSPALRPIWDALVSGLQFLGVLFVAVGFVLSLLIASIGLLVRHSARLEMRIRLLETVLINGGDAMSSSPKLRSAATSQIEPRRAV